MPADRVPKLRDDLTVVERTHGGASSFVVKDPTAQTFFRFGPTEMAVMRRFDGRRTAHDIATDLSAGGVHLSGETVARFASDLASTGLMELTLAEQCERRMERLRTEPRRGRLFRGDVLRMRWSFGDPDKLLERALPWIRWMFTPLFIAVVVAVLAVFATVVAGQLGAFAAAVSATYGPHHLTVARALTMWCTAAVIILVHELGHGFACKHFGGEVRELGFMLLYLQPAFYCNVNDAWSFPERRARLWVNAAGSVSELAAVGLAAAVWLVAAPDTFISDVTLAAMVFSGATTVLGNMNPLLPLDGYFALADWLEIPNLRQRAMAHLAWWIKARVFQVELPEPRVTHRERRVFLTYSVLANAYIAIVLVTVATFALGWVQRVAGGIGVAAGVTAIGIATRGRVARRWRALGSTLRDWRARSPRTKWKPLAFVLVGMLVVCAVVPWPLTARGPFVVQPATSIAITAPDSGIVGQVMVSEGDRLAAGAPVARLVDRALERRWLQTSRLVDSSVAAEAAARAGGRAADAERLAGETAALTARAAAIERRLAHLIVRATSAGTVTTARPADLLGQATQRRRHVARPRVRLGGSPGVARQRRGDAGARAPGGASRVARRRVRAVDGADHRGVVEWNRGESRGSARAKRRARQLAEWGDR